MNSVIAIRPIASSVRAAFRPGGGLKALTRLRDRLDAGQRGRARGERLEEDEEADGAGAGRDRVRCLNRRASAGRTPADARADQDEHRRDERVGREGEQRSRFPDAPEVGDRGATR